MLIKLLQQHIINISATCDLKSYLFKHLVETNHKMVALDDLKIIGKGYKSPKFRRNLGELLHIKEKGSS